MMALRSPRPRDFRDIVGSVDHLEVRLRRLAERSGAARLAVVAGPVGGPRGVRVEPDTVFHAASTMKVAVLVELYRRIDAGALRLDEALPVRNEFRSLVDGSPFALDPADDTEPGLYGRTGATAPIRELARLMIVRSSNLATNLLIDRLGAPAVDATACALGAPGVRVLRGLEDDLAYAAGRSNTVTADGLATLLERLAEGSAASPAACEAMLDVLAAQEFNEGIPAGLPAGTRVAHKTGSIPSVYHDAGVVYPAGRRPYVLVVLTEGLDEAAAAPALVAGIAREVDLAMGPT